MSEQLPKSDFEYIINDSFLAFFSQEEGEPKFGYDAVFHIGNNHIYLLHEEVELQSDKENVPKSLLYEGSKHSVNELMHRHIKLQKSFFRKRRDYGLSEDDHYCFVGLASLMVSYKGNIYSIDHQFGSTYFQEQCIFDIDVDENFLQLFGTKSVINILKITNTPTDLLEYLSYHKKTLVRQRSYRHETILANLFLHSNKFFGRPLSIEKKLIDIGLLDKHDNRLLKTIQSNDPAVKDSLIKKMRDFSGLWVKLLQMTVSRQLKLKQPLEKDFIEVLFSESLYTRMKIIEDVFGYGRKSDEERENGYIMYQHSYSKFGRQYMIIMYADDKDSWLSRGSVKKEHLNMLINLNSQLQDSVMEDLILIGFDMSEIKPNGDVDVQMDIYYQKGSEMTELEYYLHNQLMELRANL